MNHKIRLIAAILLLFMLCIGGISCDYFDIGDINEDVGCAKQEYITVGVSVQGRVQYRHPSDYYKDTTYGLAGAEVRVEVIKDGGEKARFYQQTKLGGHCGPFECSFKLYREQPIDAVMYVESVEGLEGFGDLSKYNFPNAFIRLYWEDVYPETDFGETYAWKPFLSVVGIPKE